MNGVDTAITRGSHPSVTVTPLQGKDKVRSLWHLRGVTPAVRYGVHNNSYPNLRRGLMERVFYVEKGGALVAPPQAGEGAFAVLESFGSAVVEKIGITVPTSVAQVVEMYKGDRRYTMYSKAAESLATLPVGQADARMKTFVKAEKINLEKKPDPAPRVIQPRSPRYNLRVAQYLKLLEKRIFKAIDVVFKRRFQTTGPIVCKGLTATGTASCLHKKWSSFRNPVAVGLDASRFDQHVGVQALKWEHSVYTRCFRGSDAADLARLLSWQITNYGRGMTPSAKLKYKREGCRMSGDINTSLGNCLLMCGMIYAYADSKRVKVDLANNGDDCVVFMEKGDLKRFLDGLPEWFLNMGFTMTVEPPVTIFEAIEFCQAHPLQGDFGWTMCRNLAALSKDLHSLLPLDNGMMAYGWATSIGMGGAALANGVPVFETLYQTLTVAGDGVVLGAHPLRDEGGLHRLSKGEITRAVGISDRARVSFYNAFGVPPYMQRTLEGIIRTSSIDLNTRGVKHSSTYNHDTRCPPLRHFI